MQTTIDTTDLDGQISLLDNARTGLLAQREGLQHQLGAMQEQWAERAAVGDVDDGLTGKIESHQTGIRALDRALQLNEAKRAEVVAERDGILAADLLAADREVYLSDLEAFVGRPDTAALIGRLLDTAYTAIRATVAEVRALGAEQGRLDGEHTRHAGTPTPPNKVEVDFAPDLLSRGPHRVRLAVTQFSGWRADQEATDAIAEYLRNRIFVTSRENPAEPVPTWEQVLGIANAC